MNDTHVVEHLAAYISGNLEEETSRTVKDHLASCRQCAAEYEALRALWDDLGRIPEEDPRTTLEQKFLGMLGAFEPYAGRPGRGRARVRGARVLELFHPARPAVRLAFGVLVAAAGFACGYMLNGKRSSAGELAQLRNEVHGLSNLLTVSLLHQESASERLKGVSLTYGADRPDPDISAALIYAMNHDRNVNVRLAALDALSREIDTPGVRREIIGALPGQSSPLMQIALVDVLVQINDAESRDALQKAMNKPGLLPDVEKRIGLAIRQIL